MNQILDLSEGDLPFLFERFWRKDKTRTSGSEHNGLGLALVRSLVEFLNFKIKTEFLNNKYLKITISGLIK